MDNGRQAHSQKSLGMINVDENSLEQLMNKNCWYGIDTLNLQKNYISNKFTIM